MTNKHNARRMVAALTVMALGGLVGWAGLAGATGPGPSGITVLPGNPPIVVEDPIRLRRGAEVSVTQLLVAAGGHTAWHYHPGPHVVAVVAGTVTVYETDCSPRGTFTAGDFFFDPGSTQPRDIHTLHNAGPETAHVVITDFREKGRPLTVPVDPQPTAACF